MLLAALEVRGPDTVRVKKGPDAGQQVSIFAIVIPRVVSEGEWERGRESWGTLTSR